MSDEPLPTPAPTQPQPTEPKVDPTPAPSPSPEPPKPEPKAEIEPKAEKPLKDRVSALNQKEEGEEKLEGPAAFQGAPEKEYEAFTAPEGYEIDPEVVKEATPLFKELGLNQEGAQKAVDFYNKQMTKVAEAPYDMYEKMREGWANDIAKMFPGPKMAETKQRIDALHGIMVESGKYSQQDLDGFKAAMDLTGAGDHPMFAKVFDAVASALVPKGYVKGNSPPKVNAPGQGGGSFADVLYGNNQK